MEKKTVYTSIPRYVRISKERAIIKDYSRLGIYPWAKKRIEEMCNEESSYAEEVFMRICRSFKYSLFRQVFFKIDNRCYFLDFFLPDGNIAIEIDGSYHKAEDVAEKDRARDAAFKSIGITTIRFSTEQMRDPDFKTKYFFPALKYVGKKKESKQLITSHQQNIKKAIAKVGECQNNEIVEIRSRSTPFLRAISRDDVPSDGARDKALLSQFYDIKRAKRLTIHPRYIGAAARMKGREKNWVKRLEAACLAKGPDRIIEI